MPRVGYRGDGVGGARDQQGRKKPGPSFLCFVWGAAWDWMGVGGAGDDAKLDVELRLLNVPFFVPFAAFGGEFWYNGTSLF